MNIQTISIVVPNKGCVNNCKFCVSKMSETNFDNHFDKFAIKQRIKYAVNNNVNTCILTGTGEALQNKKFLTNLAEIFEEMDHPFPNVALQTSGVLLMDDAFLNVNLLKRLGVNTISLSVSEIRSSDINLNIMQVPPKLKFKLKTVCKFIKDQGFNLRLSLNMTRLYDDASPSSLFATCLSLGADQITFRKLYHSNDNSVQTNWVKENAIRYSYFPELISYVKAEGSPKYRLSFGAMVYSVHKMSVAIDDDCMSKNNNDKETLKYVILQKNGKLYSDWDDEGSLIF